MTALLIEFLRRDGDPLQLADLGVDYLTEIQLPLARAQRPFRVEAEPQLSKKSNVYFEYQQAGVPLPDGLETRLRVGGVEVKFGEERKSQAGNPTREGKTVITVDDMPYEVTAFFTKARQHFWIKVHAQKASGRAVSGPRKPIVGGRIV